jgi:hypothetical protein
VNLRREIHKCQPHGDGMLVRVRFVPLGEDGKDILTPPATIQDKDGKEVQVQHPIHYEIERVIRLPWNPDDTHESYVKRALDFPKDEAVRAECVLRGLPVHENGLTWAEEAEINLRKILLHNGLLKPLFSGVPVLDKPKAF